MFRKKWLMIIGLLLIVICYNMGKDNLSKEDEWKAFEVNPSIPLSEKKAFEFIVKKNSGLQLSIYTNYIDRESENAAIATGKDILSESQGLFLYYLLNRDEKELFDLCLNWTINHLHLDNGTFSWVKTKSSEIHTNALIDDLRIVRVLLLASEKWQDKSYLKYMNQSAKSLLTYNVDKEMPRDFYDKSSKEKSKSITISYLDLYTMKELAQFESRWEGVYNNAYQLIINGKIEGTGLYELQYDLEEDCYVTGNEINLIQSIYTMVHLSEIGKGDKEGIKWLDEEYKRYGKVFAYYSYENHKPVSTMESTALYALMARLFYLEGDYPKAKKLLKECERFQVRDKTSEIYGGFGNKENKEVYSFDNLQYLLSSSMLYKEN